jgi:hypothetical protein
MIKKRFIFLSLIIFFSLTLSVTLLFFPRQKHFEAYQQTIEQRLKISEKVKPKAHHTRENVQKEIYLCHNFDRTHTRIYCDKSELFLLPEKGKFHLLEQLYHIQCWIQDSVSEEGKSPTQQVRYMTAEKGTYLFPSHRFFANEITLQFFSLEGNDLPSYIPPALNPFLKGFAKEVSFSFSDKTPSFQAKHLTTTFEIQKME